jgi:hypothetical protein
LRRYFYENGLGAQVAFNMSGVIGLRGPLKMGSSGYGDFMSGLKLGFRRKMHGLSENRAPIDPKVFSRRGVHVRIVNWLIKWARKIQIFLLLLGICTMIVPLFSTRIRGLVETVAPLHFVADQYTRLKPLALFFLFSTIALSQLLVAFGRHFPGGWNVKERNVAPSPHEIRDLELFPNNIKEEAVFYLFVLYSILTLGHWLIGVGLVGYFIKFLR